MAATTMSRAAKALVCLAFVLAVTVADDIGGFDSLTDDRQELAIAQRKEGAQGEYGEYLSLICRIVLEVLVR